MRRAVLPTVVVLALAGCGGGGTNDDAADRIKQDVTEQADKVRERVEAAGKPDVVDQALLDIEKSDLPDDIKHQLLEAKELLDKYEP